MFTPACPSPNKIKESKADSRGRFISHDEIASNQNVNGGKSFNTPPTSRASSKKCIPITSPTQKVPHNKELLKAQSSCTLVKAKISTFYNEPGTNNDI